ncbi:MAG: MORN repeat-containing protein [Spirochaetota bacterium]
MNESVFPLWRRPGVAAPLPHRSVPPLRRWSALSLFCILGALLFTVGCATAPEHGGPAEGDARQGRGEPARNNGTREPGADARGGATLVVESNRDGTLYVDGVEVAEISRGEDRSVGVEPGPLVVSIAPTTEAERFQRISVDSGATRRVVFDFGDTPEDHAEDPAGDPDGSDPSGEAPPQGSPLAGPARSGPSPIERDADPNAPSGTMVVRTPRGTYDGDIRQGIPHGTGTMEWDDGAVYRGEWVEGRPDGSGEYRWPDDARYLGRWRDGRRHGAGSMQWDDGTYYEGTWKDGHPEGTGLMEWPDGTTYEGEFVAGRPDGVGTYNAPDDLRYEGEFAEGRAVGGILTVPSGQKYWASMNAEGEWVRERPVDEETDGE